MVLYQMIKLNYFVLPYRIKLITIRMWMRYRWRNLHCTNFLFRFRFINFLVLIIVWLILCSSFLVGLIRIWRKLCKVVWNRRQLDDFTSQYLAFLQQYYIKLYKWIIWNLWSYFICKVRKTSIWEGIVDWFWFYKYFYNNLIK